jgi:signal transduction histidine kinase
MMSRFLGSLYFKIGSVIIIAELIVLALVGNLYIDRFSSQIDLRSQERASLPGTLVQKSLLRLISIRDSESMRRLLGADLINTILLDRRGEVAYSLLPLSGGKSLAEVSELNASWFNYDQPTDTIETIKDANGNYIVSVSPILSAIDNSIEYYLYVKISTNAAEAEKQEVIVLVVAGSVATVVATSIVIFFSFYLLILERLSNTLKVVRQVENGNLSARVLNTGSKDEVGIVQNSINAMITQLEDLVGSLEAKVAKRTNELEHARAQAVEASNAKSVFLSNMSHELRTPLNMVIGYTSSMLNMPQMYLNIPLPEIYKPDIELIRSNGMYLLDLINDILDLSKIEAGQFEVQFEAFNLVMILNGVIATSVGLIKNKPIQITPDYETDLPHVWGDPMRIRQILLNLMTNAIKFTSTGSVVLSAKYVDNHIQISVTDTGAGISPDVQKRIFDRFQQARKEDAIQGTGLGLDISQHLAQLHHTEITIESAIGKGSTFNFILSTATADQLTTTLPRRGAVETTVKVFENKVWTYTPTVLIVEHDADKRQSLHTIFENANYVVVETHSAEDAVLLSNSLLPELIVLDNDLVLTQELSLLEQLKTNPETSQIPVLLLALNSISQSQAEGILVLNQLDASEILNQAAAVLRQPEIPKE